METLDKLFLYFWTTMVFTSIAWYAYLLFHVGIRGVRARNHPKPPC